MRHDEAGPGIVLSPHPDDAVLSAWSALRRDGDVVVVNVFSGIPEAGIVGRVDRMLGATDSAQHMRVRIDEDARALALAGRDRDRVNLGLLDGQYRETATSHTAIRDAIEQAAPAAAWICAPAGLGGHDDHTAVRDVALEMARDASLPLTLYADLPYAIEWGWPAWVTGAPPRPFLVPEARWDRDLDGMSVSRDCLLPRVEALEATEATRKLEALETYRTQFSWLNAGPLDRLRNPEVLGYELHWDVRAP
jgi:LmbE family N-acetylglucosaminyl deacetylase